MTGYGDDASSLRINLLHMPIYLGWSGSVSRLGNKPIRILILDELDKYKNPKNEASSESLAEKRTTTWRTRRKVVKISTPTTEDGPIWKALTEEAGARFDFWVRCPHCGFFQHMDFERIAWPGKDEEKSPDAETVLAKRLAYYACEHCGAVWDDGDRDRAVRGGEWRDRVSGLELMAHATVHRPVKVGFHIPAWLSYFVSLSEVAHAWLKYKESGKLDDLKNFRNQYAAEPWVESHAARSEDAILALCDDRPTREGSRPGGRKRAGIRPSGHGGHAAALFPVRHPGLRLWRNRGELARGVRLGGQPRGAGRNPVRERLRRPGRQGIRGQGSHDRRDGRAHRRGLPVGRPSSGPSLPVAGRPLDGAALHPLASGILPRRQGQARSRSPAG